MGGLTIACVRAGTRYGREYVERLRSMVAKHLPIPHRFVCLTDQPEEIEGVERIDIAALSLAGWFAKIALFSPAIRGRGRCIYFDLDTAIVGDLSPLAAIEDEFAICESFTRLAGNADWPCRYGSCCMVMADGFGEPIWRGFRADMARWTGMAGRFGDQWIIERLAPKATMLQDATPPGFFLGYRDLPRHRDTSPPGACVVVFAGRAKPHNCEVRWIKAAWR